MQNIPKAKIEDIFKFKNKDFQFKTYQMPEGNYESGNISPFETMIICLLCVNLQPIDILEFGTFNGRTTSNIAANTPDNAKIITVDLPKEEIKDTKFPLEGVNKKNNDSDDELGYVGRVKKAYQNYPHLNEKITQFWMDTAKFPVSQYKGFFDFIFVDASHSYENALNDSYTAFKCSKEGGVILWHDYQGWPGVTKALNEVYKEFEYSIFHIHDTSMVLCFS